MKLQYLQSAEGEERIYLDIQGSVHAYLHPREGGTPDWTVKVFNREDDNFKADHEKVNQLYRDIFDFVSAEFDINGMDEVQLVRWENLRDRAIMLEETAPTAGDLDHEASMHGFMEKCRRVPKKWANARMNVERQKLERQH
jgi:hypothetical protein